MTTYENKPEDKNKKFVDSLQALLFLALPCIIIGVIVIIILRLFIRTNKPFRLAGAFWIGLAIIWPFLIGLLPSWDRSLDEYEIKQSYPFNPYDVWEYEIHGNFIQIRDSYPLEEYIPLYKFKQELKNAIQTAHSLNNEDADQAVKFIEWSITSGGTNQEAKFSECASRPATRFNFTAEWAISIYEYINKLAQDDARKRIELENNLPKQIYVIPNDPNDLNNRKLFLSISPTEIISPPAPYPNFTNNYTDERDQQIYIRLYDSCGLPFNKGVHGTELHYKGYFPKHGLGILMQRRLIPITIIVLIMAAYSLLRQLGWSKKYEPEEDRSDRLHQKLDELNQTLSAINSKI